MTREQETPDLPAELEIRRLGWAGVEIRAKEMSLLIDPLLNDKLWGLSIGSMLTPLPREGPARHVLVTHLHGDHFDPVALREVLTEESRVVCFEDVATTVASRGYPIRSARLYEPLRLGPFIVAPVPAVDGFGIAQVSWVVSAFGARFIHGGDTMWHGHWWDIGRQYAPFDAAFLPVNGFRFKGREPDVDVPSSLTPEQAVAAATVLRARRLVPIHYGMAAPFYVEEPDIEKRLKASVSASSLKLSLLATGEALI